jgi:glycosyltransferase involved in cell wall biosynthesis
VLVLDDGSTDRTYEIVAAIAAREPRLRVLRGEQLPKGWVGKNFACAQLAAAASHPLLLFVDADVRLAGNAACRLAAAMRESNAQFISGVPRQELGTVSEKLLVPLIHFLLLGFLPLARMRRSKHPAYGSACGQLIMVDRAAYERSGGHRAIRGNVHDGLALPKQFRRSGFHTDLVDVTDLATCRMYRRNADVWRGFGKNTHEGLGAPARIVPFTVLLLAGQVLPFRAAREW